MNLDDFIINESSTILDALNKLNRITELSKLNLFVCDNDGVLIGSLTDGDVRRALAVEQDLHVNVGEICNKNPTFIWDSESYVSFREYKDNNIKLLPVLSEKRKIIRLIDLKYNYAQLPADAVIMAGGRGKRLSPLTDNIPKPMLPLDGKPIIEYTIDRLISYGVRNIYISLGYMSEVIEDYFMDGQGKGVNIEYIHEDVPLGTIGSLSLLNNISMENLFVVNGDLISNVNYENLYKYSINENADITIVSKEYKIDIPYAVIESHNRKVQSIEEKPTINLETNAGIYLLKKQVLTLIPKGEYFNITDLFDKILSLDGNILIDRHRGYWIDIGRIEDYQAAQDLIKIIKN